MSGAFLLKIAFGVALWAIYTYHYTYRNTSDAFRYFDDAMVIRSLLWENPSHFFSFMFGYGLDNQEFQVYFDQMRGWTSSYSYGITNDNPTIIRINVLISLFSFGYYHVHTVFMSFMAFTGLTALYRAFVGCFKAKEKFLFIACFLLPSVLFWSSGVLKEAPLMMGMGLFILSISKFGEPNLPWNKWLFLFSSVFLFFIKEYVLLSLIPGMLFFFIARVIPEVKAVWIFLVVHLVCFVLALNAHHIYPAGDFLYILSKKQTDFYNVAEMQNSGSTIDLPPIDGVGDFILNYPRAFYLTWFRPDVMEVKSAFYALVAAENMVYILLLFLAAFFFKRIDKEKMKFFLFGLSFVLILSAIIGSTVPILGAVIRYRIPALPVFVIILGMVLDWNKIQMKHLFHKKAQSDNK